MKRIEKERLMTAALVLVFTVSAAFLSGCGRTGDQGDAGAQGPAGVVPMTVVQLCPGVPHYGVFIEVAYCIEDQLYATYSANGGFTTLLSPGTYGSQGVNSSCNFVVADHCQVLHEGDK